MTREIGEVFEYNGVKLIVVEETDYYFGCDKCYMTGKCSYEGIEGDCNENHTDDNKNRIFVEVKE
jgi:hypothetical protein